MVKRGYLLKDAFTERYMAYNSETGEYYFSDQKNLAYKFETESAVFRAIDEIFSDFQYVLSVLEIKTVYYF